MTDLPDLLALTSIDDGSKQLAAPLRNNYAAIQTGVNALVGLLGGGTAAAVLQAVDADTVQWLSGFSTYTPAWTSTGTAPSLGNGTNNGRYLQVAKLVVCQIRLIAGTTTTFGSGAWLFSLPATSNANWNGVAFGGRALDSSAGSYYPLAAFTQTGTQVGPVTVASPVVSVSPVVPFTWASGDTLDLAFVYEAA